MIEKNKKALLISIYQGTAKEKAVCDDHLEELALLCETYGIEPIFKAACPIRRFDAATYLSSGKLAEMIALSKEHKAELVVFDDEITATQQRNLEKEFGIPVSDRTEVILGVFSDRAHSREAKNQVELAQVTYQLPRLKRLWTHLERQTGTAGASAYTKGMGEKQIEIDRRLLEKRIDRLNAEIDEMKEHRATQRVARIRSSIPVFAIVGYTNAGKSTLLNALTDAGVFVEDKLFATLDTTTRKYHLSNNQEVLLTDTVGFIRKLPHLLVAAFRSTLEEAVHADFMLHLVDVSNPLAFEQAETTMEVLKELGADEKRIITVLNKIDKVENPALINSLRVKFPKNVRISALQRRGFDDLEKLMIKEISSLRKLATLRIPQSEYAVVSEIMQNSRVIHTDYEENDVVLRAEIPTPLYCKYQKYAI